MSTLHAGCGARGGLIGQLGLQTSRLATESVDGGERRSSRCVNKSLRASGCKTLPLRSLSPH